MDPARSAAFEVLKAVRVEEAYANLVLPHVLAAHGLTGRDAAFATELVSGTLRQQGTYDAVLSACLDRPIAKVEAKVRDLLRLGCHQLLSMRVPDHAAISATVDLVKVKANAGAGSFANAVLRKVAGRTLPEWIEEVAPPGRDRHGRAAIAHSHPRWVVDELAAALAGSGSAAELEELLAADNAAPKVVLVARPGRASVEELPGESTAYSPFGVVLAAGQPGEVPAVAEGRAGVQDEGSQLVALALAQAPLEGRDERWLDLCAGPGGKSALLAALAARTGASLTANEAQPHRARLVRRNLTDTLAPGGPLVPGATAVVAADGRRPPFPEGAFDRVLVDAPCSGLGALRRRPEARWRRRPSDLEELVPLQRELLTSALALVRPGGLVLYATCSPVLAETAGVVREVLTQQAADAELVPWEHDALGVPRSDGPMPGTIQLWPHRHGTDAMFLALLRRREQSADGIAPGALPAAPGR
ncbi:RsmB/NOP family class I SAM-dependent RNA methyltransferase [Nocardioides insulae]|uniref:RsmB/NOP family class I SAM-dependent RNA methyltransferase n=1 Tax=Nocardioides insulae TaxID=394734 RepID=UPI0004250994|nr:transcription antitermination factor NusB [Nocardioides insulae]